MGSRTTRPRRAPPGAPPGTLIADPNAPAPEIQVITYGPDRGPEGFSRQKVASVDELPAVPAEHGVCWIDIAGLGDHETIRRIGERFNFHPLALEDTLNVRQRPKVEDYDDHLFIVTRMPVNDPAEDEDSAPPARSGSTRGAWAHHAGQLVTEQVAFFVGDGFVITFQERPGDVFEPVRTRIMKASGRIRSRAADYLAYALLDAAIDSFFPLLEAYGERVEDLEQEVVERPESGHIAHIHDLKRDLLTARRTIWPQREMLNTLVREEPYRGRDAYLPAGLLRPHDPVDGHDRDLSRGRLGARRCAAVECQQSHERGDEGPHDDRDGLHPFDVHRGNLWHELRSRGGSVEHA